MPFGSKARVTSCLLQCHSLLGRELLFRPSKRSEGFRVSRPFANTGADQESARTLDPAIASVDISLADPAVMLAGDAS